MVYIRALDGRGGNQQEDVVYMWSISKKKTHAALDAP